MCRGDWLLAGDSGGPTSPAGNGGQSLDGCGTEQGVAVIKLCMYVCGVEYNSLRLGGSTVAAKRFAKKFHKHNCQAKSINELKTCKMNMNVLLLRCAQQTCEQLRRHMIDHVTPPLGHVTLE